MRTFKAPVRPVLVALAFLALPAAAHAAPVGSCVPREAETRVTARVTSGRVIACDVRTRRERVLRRERGDRELMAAAANGRRVAWTEVERQGRRRWVGRLIVADGLTGRRIGTRLVFRARESPRDFGVAYTSAGDLAWQAPPDGRLVLQRRGRSPRVVTQRVSSGLRAVDRGATLRWISYDTVHAWLDVRPGPRACRLRDGFRAVYRTPQLVVSRATFTERTVTTHVHRGCVRGAGRDPVFHVGRESFGGGESVDVAGHAGPFLLVRHDSTDKNLVTSSVASVDLRTGASQRSSVWEWPAQRSAAVLPDGSYAWIEHYDSEDTGPIARVMFTRRGGAYSELGYADSHIPLDRAGRGQLAGLRADGATLRWTHAGEPRSYP